MGVPAAVIRFEGVCKRYRAGLHSSLREAVGQAARRLVRGSDSAQGGWFWALRDVSFELDGGHTLGVIGANGAGKTTILKLLAHITLPDAGRIVTAGRVAPLIELGAGFHPDLTGRENIYLNGAILGLKRREIDARFADIVDFSELGPFLDTPVKRYSSGMYVRLAFAVAAHVQADILLIDEVLSVGDSAFQRKCLQRMKDLQKSGASILFVSHNLWSVQGFCDRAIFLKDGRVQVDGPPAEAIQAYERDLRASALERLQGPPVDLRQVREDDGSALSPVTITGVELVDEQGRERRVFARGEPVTVRAHYQAAQPVPQPTLWLGITRADGLTCCTARSSDDGVRLPDLASEGVLEAHLPGLALNGGVYYLAARIYDTPPLVEYAQSLAQRFEVQAESPGRDADEGVFVHRVVWGA